MGIETYYEDGQWKNKTQGASRASRVYNTKAEAQAEGRKSAIAHRVEHAIKNMDGTISAKNSYGSDPVPPQG